MAKNLGAVQTPRIYGYLLASAVTGGYLVSNIFYWKAGKAYTKFMERRDQNKATKEQADTIIGAYKSIGA